MTPALADRIDVALDKAVISPATGYAIVTPVITDAARSLSRLLRELDRAVDGRTSDKSSADRWAHNLARAKVLEIIGGVG